MEPSKTRLIKFGRFAKREAQARGRRPETLYFLGFVHYVTRNRQGNFKVGRKTEKSRLGRSLISLKELMRHIRHWSLKDQARKLGEVLRGHYAYYGLAGNVRSLLKVHRYAEWCWHRMLSSRSWGLAASTIASSACKAGGLTRDERVLRINEATASIAARQVTGAVLAASGPRAKGTRNRERADEWHR